MKNIRVTNTELLESLVFKKGKKGVEIVARETELSVGLIYKAMKGESLARSTQHILSNYFGKDINKLFPYRDEHKAA